MLREVAVEVRFRFPAGIGVTKKAAGDLALAQILPDARRTPFRMICGVGGARLIAARAPRCLISLFAHRFAPDRRWAQPDPAAPTQYNVFDLCMPDSQTAVSTVQQPIPA